MSIMQPLWLDYQQPAPGQQWPGRLLLILGLLFCGLLLTHLFFMMKELTVVEPQVYQLKREAERRRLPVSMESASSDTLPQRKASPSAARWESLLRALENAGDDSVTLLGLEPGHREIMIAGEARNLDASLDYAKRLQAATAFSEVHLVKHEIIRENPFRPVRFALQARWSEAPQ